MANKFDKARKNFNKQIMKVQEEFLKSDVAKELGKLAQEQIKKRTRLGYGLSNGKNGEAKRKRLKRLSEPYKKQRGRMNLSGETSAKRSNLTQSGDMLDDIDYKIKAKTNSGRKVKLSFSDSFSKKKAEWNSKDRKFFGLTKPEKKLITAKLAEKLRKVLKKIIK